MKCFHGHADGFREIWRIVRGNFELLKIDGVIGVLATVDHVEAWHREQRGISPPQGSGRAAVC